MLQQSLFFFFSPGDRCIQSGFWEKTSRWYFCSVTFCLHLTQYSCTSFKHSKPLRVSFLCGWAILDQPIFIEGKTILLDSSYSWARGHGGVIALREIHSGTTRFYNSNCRLFFFFPSLSGLPLEDFCLWRPNQNFCNISLQLLSGAMLDWGAKLRSFELQTVKSEVSKQMNSELFFLTFLALMSFLKGRCSEHTNR